MNADDLPDAPDALPAYVVDPVTRQNPERLRTLAKWAEDVARAKENRAVDEFDETIDAVADDDQAELVERGDGDAVYTRMVDCGKDNCSACPHGPYKFRTFRRDGKVRTEHLGRATD